MFPLKTNDIGNSLQKHKLSLFFSAKLLERDIKLYVRCIWEPAVMKVAPGKYTRG